MRSSTTQPGLPAQSSVEAGTRVTSKTACEGIFLQAVAGEWNIFVELEVHSDASVAVRGSQKFSGGQKKHPTVAQTLIRTLVKSRLCRVRRDWNQREYCTFVDHDCGQGRLQCTGTLDRL